MLVRMALSDGMPLSPECQAAGIRERWEGLLKHSLQLGMVQGHRILLTSALQHDSTPHPVSVLAWSPYRICETCTGNAEGALHALSWTTGDIAGATSQVNA